MLLWHITIYITYVPSNDRMIVNDELKLKRPVVHVKVVSHFHTGKTQETHSKPQLKQQFRVLTLYLPNTSHNISSSNVI